MITRYYENECLDLAWDCIKVRQVAALTTTVAVKASFGKV